MAASIDASVGAAFLQRRVAASRAVSLLVAVPGWRMGVFPFGRPVVACEPLATGRAAMFVLGAYPSALDVRWRPPQGEGRVVQALAVDNEPEPFWAGADEVHRVERWMSQVGWSEAWGSVAPVSHLNGPSGRWVEEGVLGPLRVARADAWITDCLNTYRASVKMRAAVEDVYEPFARAHALPPAELAPHPSEAQIVGEGIDQDLSRLRRELTASAPDLIVTLGNTALRVLRNLLGDAAAPMKLTVTDYGTELSVKLNGRGLSWLPLAHPAAPGPYQVAHENWMAGRTAAP